MGKTNPKVDSYIGRQKMWQNESQALREIALSCKLEEELKWGKPCYAYHDSNVVIIQGFKGYCALLFFKGVLLKDSKGILHKTGENTRVGRQARFTSVGEIAKLKPLLKTYIAEAIELEKAGVKVKLDDDAELALPEEVKTKFTEMPELKAAFEALTPGRQRGYQIFFSAPKQAKTRESRIEKCLSRILDGKGLND